MIRLLFQGDSITDGNRLKDPESRWDLNHQIGHSYAFTIAGELGSRHPGKYAFINRGLSGDSVESISLRWQRDTLDEKPDILSLLLGINGNGNFDGRYPEGTQAHLDAFSSGYRALLQSARQNNPALKIILMEPFCLPVGKLQPHYGEFMQVFSQKQQTVAAIAKDFGAVFVPIQKNLEALAAESAPMLQENGCTADPCAYWMWDGIHPTEPLHHMLAKWWLKAAGKIL